MGNFKKLLVFAAIAVAALPCAVSAGNDLTKADFTITSSDLSILKGNLAGKLTQGGGNVNIFAAGAVRLMMIALALLCTVLIVAGGIWMATAGGDSDRVSRGKTLVTYALVGLAVALSSYALISLV